MMATSEIFNDKFARKQFTTNEFTVAAGRTISANFAGVETLNIPGYSFVGWFVSGGSNAEVRGGILAFTVNWPSANIKLYNVSTSSITGTLSIYALYVKDIVAF